VGTSGDRLAIRKLLPVAASASLEAFQAMASSGLATKSYEANGHNLTFLLVDLHEDSRPDVLNLRLNIKSAPGAAADALIRGGIASVIHDEYITDFECDVKGDEADGEVAFEAKSFWRGRVGFRAERRDGRWRVTEFRLLPCGRVTRLLPARGTPFHPRLKEYWKLDPPKEPSDAAYVGIEKDGTMWLCTDPLPINGLAEKAGLDELRASLKRIARASPRGENGLPTTRVRIEADPTCEYRRVQAVMVACMKAYIWRISFGVRGKHLDANLPNGAGTIPRTPDAGFRQRNDQLPRGTDEKESNDAPDAPEVW
jgi:biopolymer transport protein ExbD